MSSTRAPVKTALLAALLVAPMLVGTASAAGDWTATAADDCMVPGLDDRCEAWGVETDHGDNWGCCGFGWIDASRHFLSSGDQVFLTLPVNDPGAPSLDERWDFQTTSFSVSDGRLLWKQRWGGPAWDIPLSLALSPDRSRLYATGYRDYPDTPNSVSLGGCVEEFVPASALTIAYDAQSGQELWRSGFSEPAFLDAALNSALSPDGKTLYQAGIRLGGDPDVCDLDAAVAALDAETGRELWGSVVARGSGGPFPYDAAWGIATTPDGERAIVSGSVRNAGSRDDFFAVALDVADDPEDPTDHPGDVVWRSFYDEGIGGSDLMTAMAFDAEQERVYVTGLSVEGTNLACNLVFITGCAEVHYATVAYDAATGKELWRRRYVGPALNHRYDTPHAIAVSPDGARVFVTGESVGTHDADWDYATVAYDALTGAQLWVARYGFPTGHIEWGIDLVVSLDGSRVYVTGDSTYAIGTSQLAATLAYDAATGQRVWIGRYDGPRGATDATHGEQMALAPDGSRLFVSGWAEDARNLDGREYRGIVFAYDL